MIINESVEKSNDLASVITKFDRPPRKVYDSRSMANSPKTEQRAFLVLLGVLLLIGFYVLYPFLNAIVLGVALAVLFQPLHETYLKWTRGRVNVATFFSVLSIILFVIVPVTVILTLVTSQLSELVLANSNAASDPSISDFLMSLQSRLTQMGVRVERLLGMSLNISAFIRKEMATVAQTVARYSPRMLVETANFLLHVFIMLVVLAYLLRDGRKILIGLIRITPIKDRYELKLAKEIHDTIHGIFYGHFLTSMLQTVVAMVFFYFLKIPGYWVWGALTFLVSFLPALGTGATIIPMSLALLLQGKTTQGLILIVFGGIVIGSIDNVLRPFLMQQNMHPMLLFLSIFGGLAVFGPVGILLGPMLIALLTATVNIYAEDFAQVELSTLEDAEKKKSS